MALAVKYHGVAHPPGYPLWTLIGILIQSLFPKGDLARQLVLFSSLSSALSAGILFLSIERFLRLSLKSASQAAVLFFSFLSVSWIYTSPHLFRQSVIIEVYGLHLLICSIVLFLFLQWFEERNQKSLYGLSLFLGLGLSNHHLILTLGFAFLSFLLFFERSFWREKKKFLKMLFFFLLGLTPYLYLLIPHSPIWNWGDINDFTSFWQHISRKQYFPHLQRSWFVFVEQTREQVILLLEQMNAVVVFIGILGLSLMNRLWRTWVLLLLFVTGPLTTWMVNFVIPIHQQLSYQDISALLSVFFLNHYQIWAFALGFGALSLLQSISQRKTLFLFLGAGVLGSALIFRSVETYQQEKMTDFNRVSVLVRNWEILTENRPSLILANWDPFSFGPTYLALAEGKLPKAQIVDVEMLKAPWYLKSIQSRYPELIKTVEVEFRDYQSRIESFLKDESSVATKDLDRSYVKLIQALIRQSLPSREVYLAISRDYKMIDLRFIQGLQIRSEYVLARVFDPKDSIPSLTLSFQDFDFGSYSKQNCQIDRLSRMMALYYGRLIIESISSLGASEEHYQAAMKKMEELRSCAPGLESFMNSRSGEFK